MNLGSGHAPQQYGSNVVVDMQQQGVGALLQCLDRLEVAGDKFFDALAMVGQGPPSLLAAQLVNMSQLCQQMDQDAKRLLLVNVPVAMADPAFSEPTTGLPRSGTGTQATLTSEIELDAWVRHTASQTSELFAERRRVAANVQAVLSVPPSKHLALQ